MPILPGLIMGNRFGRLKLLEWDLILRQRYVFTYCMSFNFNPPLDWGTADTAGADGESHYRDS